MFWRFGGYANVSSLDSILDKPDVTVEELLDEADLIQELKSQNSKLIEFLRDENVLERLLQYVVAPKLTDEDASAEPEEEPTSANPLNSFFGKGKRRSRSKSNRETEGEDESKEEKQRLKYAYMACEVLSSDVWSISEALLANRDSMRKFWEYLKLDAPLDGVQAGYFTKVNEALLDKKVEEMIDFFKSLDDIVLDMLRHVDCPVIMDLLLKIISLDRTEGGQGIVDWLQAQDLIPLLLSKLSADHEAGTQTSAGDFLKAIITISANATAQDNNVIGPNELTRQLVSDECIQMLITDMLRGGNPLTVGVGIVIEVIRKNNSDYDLENQTGPIPKSSDPIYLGTLLRQFASHIPDFMNLINSTGTEKKELKVAFGGRIEPLGFDRFKTCELMAELLHCSNMALLNERGSDSEVKARDAERSRLKAEGKLTAMVESSSTHEFGTSVDSAGFHHARAPSFGDSPEEIKRLEVLNNAEDEFENVTASEALVDEMKDDFDEKEPDTLQKDNMPADTTDLEKSVEALDDESASGDDTNEAGSPTTPKAASSKDADSPTSADLTEKLGSVGIDEDIVMKESPVVKSDENKTAVGLLSAPAIEDADLSAHPEDKPAPLFSGKPRPKSISEAGTVIAEASSEQGSHDAQTSSPQGDDLAAAYEVDVDGSPVVGDLLKMMFVEHHVVPTILDFFFRFPWNNFLHNVVYDVVQQVFNGQMSRGFNRSLAIDLFNTGRITERIVEGQIASDKAQAEKNTRLGYMGHLTLIAEEVVKFSERHPPELLCQSVLDKVMSQQWIDYVEQTLAETRERDNAILGGVRPDMSVGPRQAVLNAVNAAQGFGGLGTSLASLTGGGLTGTGALGLDSAELASAGNADAGGAGAGYLFSGTSLLSGLSGFSHGSSDEEDEEMEDGESDRRPQNPISDADQVGELSFDDVDMDYR